MNTSNERDGLATCLDRQRDAVVRKARGVADADARKAPTASSLSLLGLLRHLTVWEERWFHCVVGGRAPADGWPAEAADDEGFEVADGDTVELWIGRYQRAAGVSREIVAGLDLDQRCARPDIIDCNVRFVLLHLIEETARHAGHADIIRETLDGSRGM
jgi:hypothetical protein